MRSRRLAALLVAVSVLWCSRASAVDIPLPDGLDRCIPIYPGYKTTFHFPSEFLNVELGSDLESGYKMSVDYPRKMITLKVEPWVSPTNLNVVTVNARASFRLEIVTSRHQAYSMYRFIEPGAPRPEETVLCPDESERPMDEHVQAMRLTAEWTQKVVAMHEPRTGNWRGSGHELVAKTGLIQESSERTFVPLEVENQGERPFPVTAIELRDERGRLLDAVLARPEEISEIPARGRVTLAFYVMSRLGSSDGMQVHISSSTGIAAASIYLHPPPPTPSRLGPLTLLVRGIGGVAQLDDGTTGERRTAWTLARGIGLGARYGTTRHTSLEGGIDVLDAGDADVGSTQTELSARGTGTRLHLGGRLHAGERIVPHVRLGLGAMLARHRFEGAGARESELRAALLVAWGLGVDLHLDEHWQIGLGVSGSAPLGGDETGTLFEASAHVGRTFGN